MSEDSSEDIPYVIKRGASDMESSAEVYVKAPSKDEVLEMFDAANRGGYNGGSED